LNNPDFHDFINNHDIIGLVNTILDDFDTVCCNDFKYVGLNRKYLKRTSGGTGSLCYHQYVSVLNSSSENGLWFKIDKLFEYNIIFEVVYIPPEGSFYSSIDTFDDIENDILNYSENDPYLFLMGDFN
jgi:hypothetical protein